MSIAITSFAVLCAVCLAIGFFFPPWPPDDPDAAPC